MKKGKIIRRVCIFLFALICTTAIIFKIIFIKEVTRFDSNIDINTPNYVSFSKESFIKWTKEAASNGSFDVSGVKEDLKDLDNHQRLMVSFGREISFFYRIRPFEPVEIKYKNDEVNNTVYVYKINYDGPIIDYSLY